MVIVVSWGGVVKTKTWWLYALKPWDLLAKVLPMSRFSKTLGAFKSNQSNHHSTNVRNPSQAECSNESDQPLRVKGSTTFFLRPFLPFDNLLFYKRRIQSNRSINMRSTSRCSSKAKAPCRQPYFGEERKDRRRELYRE